MPWSSSSFEDNYMHYYTRELRYHYNICSVLDVYRFEVAIENTDAKRLTYKKLITQFYCMAKEKGKPEKPKEPKKCTEKYSSKLAVKGTFEDVIKASFLGKPKDKK